MAEKKQRTLSYRRASWLTGSVSKSLEDLLRGALGKFSTVASTKIIRNDDSVIGIAHRRAKIGEPVYLHICLHTPGEGASTVPKADAVAETDLGVAPAPAGREYLDGDAMVLVSGSDVVICVSNMHEASVANYLRDFICNSSQGKDAHKFDLLKIANRKIIDQLISGGVKRLTLDVHAFEQTLNPEGADDRADLTAARSGMTRLFGALIKRDQSPAQVMEAAQVEAAISIRADMRRHGGAEVVAGEAASRVLDLFDSGYEIETVSGIRITSEEIAVRARFSFPVDGKTVKYKSVWDQLARFYNTLLSDGINAQ